MINTETIIYMDTLSLLLSDKTNIRGEIYNNLLQGDDYVFDNIIRDLEDYAEELGLDPDITRDVFDNLDVEVLMNFITHDENKITFDYDESINCGDHRCVAFDIPITFDEKKFFESNCFKERYEELEKETEIEK